MSSLTADLEARLKEGGWELQRTGKHGVWRHPNGAVHCVSGTLRDVGVDRVRAMHEIDRKEKDPRCCTRNPQTFIQETPVTHNPIPDIQRSEIANAVRVAQEPKKPDKTAVWYKVMKYWREWCRIGRGDLAARMTPFLWTSATVKALETGMITLTNEELAKWAEVTKARDYLGDMVVPALPKDDPSVQVRMPRAPKSVVTPAPKVEKTKLVTLPALNDFIRKTRLDKGINQTKVAAALGISQGRLSRLETGGTQFRQWELDRWIRFLGVVPPMEVPILEDGVPPSVCACDPIPVCVPGPASAPYVPQLIMAVPSTTTRAESLARLSALLSNHRFTDEEIVPFADQLVERLSNALLWGAPLAC